MKQNFGIIWKMTLAAIAFVVVIFLSGCGSKSEPDFTTEDRAWMAQFGWSILDEEQQAQMCNLYFTMPKEEMFEQWDEQPGEGTYEDFDALYQVMNKECG